MAIIPSPSIPDSFLSFDEGRDVTIECQSHLNAMNLAIRNTTQILSNYNYCMNIKYIIIILIVHLGLNASGTSVSYTNCEADLSLNQPHECTGIIQGTTVTNMFDIIIQRMLQYTINIVYIFFFVCFPI